MLAGEEADGPLKTLGGLENIAGEVVAVGENVVY